MNWLVFWNVLLVPIDVIVFIAFCIVSTVQADSIEEKIDKAKAIIVLLLLTILSTAALVGLNWPETN